MDNVTHTLIGLAAAEAWISAAPSPEPPARQRVRLWLASALANNMPDLDVAYTWGGDRLDYLLHHRGHTHTLLLAPLQGALLLGILWLFLRRKESVPWKSIVALSLAGPVLHVLADGWNTYGVHPFWPWDNHWYYGDLVFIIEPWLWVALLPYVWSRVASLWGKSLCLAPLAFILVLGWRHPIVQPGTALAFTFGAVAWLAAQKLVRPWRLRLAGAFGLCVLAISVFAWAQARVRPAFAAEGAEVVVQSHPANPFCATVFTAGLRGDQYRATLWTAAPFPSLVPAGACRRFHADEMSAGLRPIEGAENSAGRVPVGEFVSTKAELERLAATCRGRAFLRFARVPFWFQDTGRDYFGDLRFDRGRGASFAEVALDGPCPRRDPPWKGRFFPEG